jgi:mRNA interferase HigB
MHVISRKTLRQFWEKYPDSETALIRWFKLMNSANFQTLEELGSVFPSAIL